MRSSKSRSRGNKNRNNRPFGGNIINRVFDSSGPDGKVRGTPQQIIEKYNQLHRDAQLSGDRVNAENFAQHAEHYTRMLAEAQREVDRAREEMEQANRDRQAERDRERSARQRNQNDVSPEVTAQDMPAEVADFASDETFVDDLVEVPEAAEKSIDADEVVTVPVEDVAADAPAPQRRRRPPVRADEGEGAAAKPRAPRRTRKPEAGNVSHETTE
ncbi:hypothetical protein BVG79_01398 [Ketogulonicigenium robustum]|uniref:DUF4167 domain-containing protein n=1 Tax=Ketogulonicigenium robustum TaxID=92947 RepID=A0A1W6NZV9_9RHOB|nr:DUF4167 domain-containing protein [Ketogulonicigenium robustum]ARO14744.1 hypothetical protein BVG79_01398 [Ketogulonicigenium robustum]